MTLSVLRLYSVGWSNDRWIVKGSEGKVLGLIEVISCHLSEGTEKSHDKTQNSRCPAEFRTLHRWNRSLERYLWTKLFRAMTIIIIIIIIDYCPPLWSSGQSSWLQI
jgi:hypothetical protein